MLSTFEIQFFVALGLDFCLGDPRWFPHPVRLIGLLAQGVERLVRRLVPGPLSGGLIAVVLVVGMTLGVSWGVLVLATRVSTLLAVGLAIFLLYLAIAYRDLMAHSRLVYERLAVDKDLGAARKAVARIVGRDTGELGQVGVIKACVESVAENMVDGITAPLFWGTVATLFVPWSSLEPISLAAVGAMTYKAINTLDSMFGYRNERYLLFGRAAARLDDCVNWPVARLSGLALVLAAWCLRLDWHQSFRIYRRDRRKHASPNGGHPEAAVAGALGIKLGGPSSYHGRVVYKPTMGETTRKIRARDILLAGRLVLVASLIVVVFLFLSRRLLSGVILS